MRWPSSIAMSGSGLQSADSAAQAPSAVSEASATVAGCDGRRLARQGAAQASRAVVAQSRIVPGSRTVSKNAPSFAAHHDQTIASTRSRTRAAGSIRRLAAEAAWLLAGAPGACGPADIRGTLLVEGAGRAGASYRN